MSLDTRTPMRRCGKRYESQEAAQRSKRGQGGGFYSVACREGCQGWHLKRKPVIGGITMKPPKVTGRPVPVPASRAESFLPAACALIDRRDSDESGAVPVRCCQNCGTGRRRLHRHHRQGKGSGGATGEHAHCPCNALTLCWVCHAWAHANPEEAEARGFIVSRSVEEPSSLGVMRFAAAEGDATQWPSCNGEWLSTAPEMREAA